MDYFISNVSKGLCTPQLLTFVFDIKSLCVHVQIGFFKSLEAAAVQIHCTWKNRIKDRKVLTAGCGKTYFRAMET